MRTNDGFCFVFFTVTLALLSDARPNLLQGSNSSLLKSDVQLNDSSERENHAFDGPAFPPETPKYSSSTRGISTRISAVTSGTTNSTNKTPTPKPDQNPLRVEMEKYLTDIFLLEQSDTKDTKLLMGDEVYKAHGPAYNGYIYHSLLGSIVKAGQKSRAWNIPGIKKCKGLRYVYQYFNQTDLTHRFTFSYQATNNKGDRQPIGMCAEKQFVCGADLPLYVWSGMTNSSLGMRFGYFYSTSTDPKKLSPDRANYTVQSKPFCYIYSQSPERNAAVKVTYPNQNLHLSNLAQFLQPVYEFYDTHYKDTYYELDQNDANFTTTREVLYIRHAFNTLINGSGFDQFCQLQPVIDYVFKKNGPDTQPQNDQVYTDNRDLETAQKNVGGLYSTPTFLGFLPILPDHCGMKQHYLQYQNPNTEDSYVAIEEARSPWVSGKHQKSLVQKPSKTTSSAQTTKVESLDNKTLKFETTNVKTTRHVMLVDKSARDESNDIENYLVDLFLFEDSVNRNHKLVAGHEVFEAKGKNYDDYIYHSRLGAVVNAGHKTRAWNIAGMNGAAKCRGLKKLYQWSFEYHFGLQKRKQQRRSTADIGKLILFK
ncbi:hypothetical protein M3Y98_00045700 [Aphelenchoides besseyi]|nr:hypothetical protein M3Y98_00045700 [Aphelenchoides besseyi]